MIGCEVIQKFTFFIEINNEGVITGLAVGFTKIYARSVGINPTTAKKIIYSEVIYFIS